MTGPIVPSVEIGRELARLRVAAGLKGREVGAALDVDKSAVSQWENGLAKPRLDKIPKLDELYGGRGEVLALFGLSPPVDELQELRARVAELESQVGLLLEISNLRAESDEHWPRQPSADG